MNRTSLTSWGIQAKLARKLRVTKPTINWIFRGRRRPTVELAEQLEKEFIALEIPLTRWDLLYGNKDRLPLVEYLKRKQAKES